MNTHKKLFTAFALGISAAFALAPGVSVAQNAPYIQREALSPRELDSLLAPIALYPDQLLGDVLMASTYPLEVSDAAQWTAEMRNSSLRGDDLAGALDNIDWDPSIKALTTVPGILQMMDSRHDWMERLGDAFMAQEQDVTDSVQRLRHMAYDAGRLRSDSRVRVAFDDGEIIIEPADSGSIYFSVYDPREMYGRWQYSDYPPVYLPPPVGYGITAGFGYGIFVPIVRPLWGWHSWDWRNHRIHIDQRRFNYINRNHRDHHPPVTSSVWRHDPTHRDNMRTHYGAPDRQRFGEERSGGQRFDRNERFDRSERSDRNDGGRRDQSRDNRSRENWRERTTQVPPTTANRDDRRPDADADSPLRSLFGRGDGSQRDRQPDGQQRHQREAATPPQVAPVPNAPQRTDNDRFGRRGRNDDQESTQNRRPPERWERATASDPAAQGNFKGNRNIGAPVPTAAAPAPVPQRPEFHGNGFRGQQAPSTSPQQQPQQANPAANNGGDDSGRGGFRGGQGRGQGRGGPDRDDH